MVTAIDRYLADKEYKNSIVRDREFKSSKEVLEGKARLLQQQGKGKRPNKDYPGPRGFLLYDLFYSEVCDAKR